MAEIGRMDNLQARLEFLKERQRTYTELLKVWTALIIATTGGVVGLFFKLEHKITWPLIALGVWLDFMFITAFVITLVEVNRTLKEMKKWTEKF